MNLLDLEEIPLLVGIVSFPLSTYGSLVHGVFANAEFGEEYIYAALPLLSREAIRRT